MLTGLRIKTARKKVGLTQKQLGNKLGLSYQSIAQWENGLRKPKLETLQRIADALSIPVTDLMSASEIGAYIKGFDDADALLSKDYNAFLDAMVTIGYSASDREFTIIEALYKLNDEGQDKAVERVLELTEIPKYKKDNEGE